MGWLDRLRGRTTPGGDVEPDPPARASHSRGHPERLTTLNIESFLRDHPRVVVDVWAPWCAPCRGFSPIFEEAAERWGDAIGFAKLHADHEPSLVRRFQVRALPSLLYFRNGRLVRREVGVLSSDRFTRQLRLVFGEAVA